MKIIRPFLVVLMLGPCALAAADTAAPAPPPAPAAAKPKPKFQYESPGIAVLMPTADEEKVKSFGVESVKAARKYLDDGALCWVREKSCVACHSTGVYMVERPALTALLGKPQEEVRADFEKSIPAKAGGNIQSVWRSSGLAAWDKAVTGKTSAATDRSLRQMLLSVTDEGLLKTIGQVEIPYITTDFELTVQAARAMANAPGWLAAVEAAGAEADKEMQERISKLKAYLKAHEPVNDYERAVKLQLAGLIPELVRPEEKAEAIAMLWRQQLPDGGWCTRRMSDLMKWHVKMDPKVVTMIQGEPDASNPGSDPYMTAWAIVLLREVAGVPKDDARIQRGVRWLKENQRVSGRWWMKSLFRGTYHYSTYISTAQALRALALCGEIPSLVEGE